LLEKALQFDPVRALDAEGARDLALADAVRRCTDVVQDIVLGRQAA
jgi:hypothetical protein